jgi:hypothetical protein
LTWHPWHAQGFFAQDTLPRLEINKQIFYFELQRSWMIACLWRNTLLHRVWMAQDWRRIELARLVACSG